MNTEKYYKVITSENKGTHQGFDYAIFEEITGISKKDFGIKGIKL